jgi:hypothetical protein
VAARRRPADRDDRDVGAVGHEAAADDETLVDNEDAVDEVDEAAADDEAPVDHEADMDDEAPVDNGAGALTAGEASKAALREVAQLTANRPEGITEVSQTDDGWTVGVEVVEVERIPSSTDILATYKITIGADGDMVSYRRIKRYARGRGDSGEGL